MGQLETLISDIIDRVGNDEFEKLIDEHGLESYYSTFTEIMAGGFPEDAATPEYVKEFFVFLNKIIEEIY